MYVHDVNEAAYYWQSPATLKGVAQAWSNDLTLGTITCFQDLSNWFISQFIAGLKKRRTSIRLSKIKQGLLEWLVEFLKRFH